MHSHFSIEMVAWILLAMIGGWLLVNAAIDLGPREWTRSLFARFPARNEPAGKPAPIQTGRGL